MIISRAPHIDTLTLTTAGNEYSKVLQDDEQSASIKRFQLKSRTNFDMQYGYETGGPYVTIPAGQTKWEDGLDAWTLTLFIKGTVDGQVAEIEWWY